MYFSLFVGNTKNRATELNSQVTGVEKTEIKYFLNFND